MSLQADEKSFSVESTEDFTYPGTLTKIKEHRRLRVLTSANSFNYFVDQGQQKGFEYEIAAEFAKYLNKKYGYNKKDQKPIFLEMIPVDRNELIPMLLDGRGDIIAAGLTMTEQRQAKIAFSTPYNKVSEVIVSHQDEGPFQSLNDLSGKIVSVRRSSSYFSSLQKLNRRFLAEGLDRIKIQTVDERLETDTLLELVSMKRYSISVADSHIAGMAVQAFDGLTLNPDLKIREQAHIAWGVNPDAKNLLKEINQFLPAFRKGTLRGNLNLKRYFENAKLIGTDKSRSESQRISRFDPYFKEFGDKFGWDWTLIASLAYQESRFRQNIKNRWGAIGLLQVKKMVAREPYINVYPIEGPKNARKNVHAGTKYLDWLYDTYFADIQEMNEDDRIKLSLAAYNAGPGRLRRARNMAKKMGLNPNLWEKNVEYALLAMHKVEPVKYVSEIRQRYLAYQLMGFD